MTKDTTTPKSQGAAIDQPPLECGLSNDSGIVGFPSDQFEDCPDCVKARRASAPAPADVALPALPEPVRFAQWTGGFVYAYTTEQVEQIRREAREYQRKVDEKIIARRDAEIADLQAALSCMTTLTDKVSIKQGERQSSAVGMKPKLWFKHLTGAECKPDGRCYDVAFTPMQGYEPLYAAPALADAPQAERKNWRALGYVEGATVRIKIAGGGWEDAVIKCAHGNGALDVEIDGKTYGWSARYCTVIAGPVEQTQKGED